MPTRIAVLRDEDVVRRGHPVIDRLRLGYVVDFIHAHLGGWSWYVFNLADAAIVCGVAALVIDSLLPRGRRADSAG